MGAAHSDPSQGKCLQLFNPLYPFFSFVFFSLFACLWHPNPELCLVCSSLFPLCPLPIHIFSLSTEKASCSSRMCGTETIVKETQMAGNKAKEDRISIHFLTTSFHFLPVWLLNTAPGKERDDSFTLCAFSSCVTCNYDRLY